ncbi:MAG: methyltransferase domain-containing protein [Actinobacteria bacterium]|nr:methyltransferase domain-containing protein [Actinomycetota bacterium]
MFRIIFNQMMKKRNTINSINNALDWIAENSAERGGIITTSQNRQPYPEVTGYLIPTLYDWGEKELARKYCRFLTSRQNKDGSFSAPDGTPYTFDTGQAARGLVKAIDDFPEVKKTLIRACDYLCEQVLPSGRMVTHSTALWGNIADERIHLYVLPPLVETGRKLNNKKYITTAKKVLSYYKKRKDLVDFNLLSHFHAYIIDSLVDLGEIDLAKKGMQEVSLYQQDNGGVPAYPGISWVCLPAVAQYALIWYKLAITDRANSAVKFLQKCQNRSGGFYGSQGSGADYFVKEEISWAVKYFLDANFWKIKTSFNLDETIFPSKIKINDGRVTELLRFLVSPNQKKVLDIGCGKGRYLKIIQKRYPKSLLYGIDISEKIIKFCPKKVNKQVGTILNIPYPDGFFDFVYCIETLEHAVRISAAISEMVRVLKKGGKIMIIDKNKKYLGKLKLSEWEQWFNPGDVREMLEISGLEVKYHEIPYNNEVKPDGLFIAWEGIKND